MGKDRLTKKTIADTLEQFRGGVYLVASELGYSHTAIYKWLKKYPELQELKDSFDGRMVDKAEYNLHEAVETGDPWAVKYALSTKGKDRGYTERQELTGKDGEPLHSWRDFIAKETEDADTGAGGE